MRAALIACLAIGAGWAQDTPIVIRAGRLLDGKGGAMRNATIVVRGTRIEKVDAKSKQPPDIRSRAASPSCPAGSTPTSTSAGISTGISGSLRTARPLDAAGNAYATLMAGFTTVQSLGALSDRDLRGAIERGLIPGPRLLTSLRIRRRKYRQPQRHPPGGAPVQTGRRRRDQAIRHPKHPGWRRAIDQRRADSGGLRRGQSAGLAGGGACALLRWREGGGAGGMHLHRARHDAGRQRARPDARARRVFRSEFPGAA